jgi:hypothetical protein
MKSFPQFLAAALITGTQRHFSRLHADYLEITMSETTNNFTVPSVVNVSVKQTGYKTIEGCNPGDHTPKAADAVLPANPPVRSETEQAGS